MGGPCRSSKERALPAALDLARHPTGMAVEAAAREGTPEVEVEAETVRLVRQASRPEVVPLGQED